MSTRQGSASYTIVIGAVTAIVVGAMMLTFVLFPMHNTFTAASFWSADTVHGSRVVTFTTGLWVFWPAIILIAITSYVWVRSRQ